MNLERRRLLFYWPADPVIGNKNSQETLSKPDASLHRHAGQKVSFSPKSEASYPLFKHLTSLWLWISNCSRDLLKCRGCWRPRGCRSVGSPRPPPYNRNTQTAVYEHIKSSFFTLCNSHLAQGSRKNLIQRYCGIDPLIKQSDKEHKLFYYSRCLQYIVIRKCSSMVKIINGFYV